MNTRPRTPLDSTLLPLFALREAGATDEILGAIADDPDVAKAAVEGAVAMMAAKLYADEAAMRREILAMHLKDTSLTTRVRNILMQHRLMTIGDLCMTTEGQLAMHRITGRKTLLEIERFLAEWGLELRREKGDVVAYALWLYGEAEYIPAKHMPLWDYRLDSRTKDILGKRETLGKLCELSEGDFMKQHQEMRYGDLIREATNQLRFVRNDLKVVNLSFRGE